MARSRAIARHGEGTAALKARWRSQSASATNRGVVAVVPVTRDIRRVYPFQVRLAARDCGLRRDSKAPAEHGSARSPLNASAIAWAASPRGA